MAIGFTKLQSPGVHALSRLGKCKTLLEETKNDLQQDLNRIAEALHWLGLVPRASDDSPPPRTPERRPNKLKQSKLASLLALGSEQEFSIAEIDSLLRHSSFPSYLLSSRRLPEVVSTIPVSSLRLRPGTLHGLATLQGGRPPASTAELSRMQVRRLMDIPHFGMISLLDLLAKLRPCIMQDPASQRQQISPTLSRVLLQLSDNVAAQRISTQDPRFRKVLSAWLTAANGSGSAGRSQETAAQLAIRLSQSSLTSQEEGQLWTSVRNVQTAIEKAMRQPLEAELSSLLASSLDPSTAQLIGRVYGFDGQGGATLQEAGDEFHLSRQRVHQLCLQIQALRPEERLFLPALEECAKVIATKSAENDADKERLLQERRLTARPFRVAGIYSATQLLLPAARLPRLPQKTRSLATAAARRVIV